MMVERSSQMMTFNLFPDVTFAGTRISDVVHAPGHRMLGFAVTGSPLAYVGLSIADGLYSLMVDIPELPMLYSMTEDPSRKGAYRVIEMSRLGEHILPEASPVLIPPGDTDFPELAADLVEDSNPATIDVMIVYTPAAAAWATANGGGINNVIAQALSRMQTALNNSQTQVTVNLVHSAQVDYVESGSSHTDLHRLTFHSGYDPWGYEGTPRYMEEVHIWRDYYKADVVALLAQVEDTGGLGWLLNV